MDKKKVCVVVASRANYGRVKYLMKAVKASDKLELQLIVGASCLLDRFGKALDVIESDGFQPDRIIHYVVEGENLTTQAKSTGLGLIELATAFQELKPDFVVTVADRFETMATAVASSYLNIPLVHIQGGEISGNIDDKVRNAITMLADYHFPATAQSADRVAVMVEGNENVFNHGCPAMDVLKNNDLSIDPEYFAGRYKSVGCSIDWTKPYVLMVQHPVTTSYCDGKAQVTQTLYALEQFPEYQKVVLWPNIDAGSDNVARGIRIFRESGRGKEFAYFKNFSPEDYAKVVNGASCCVGNSSSFIRECAYLGVPSVIIGDRQQGRECGANVVHAGYSTDDIKEKVGSQLSHGRYDSDDMYGKGAAGEMIAKELERIAETLQTGQCGL
jgi:UDP-hydrolysing UDP-N-acetyl-D-glucosamine 2-epimerase